MTDLSAPLPFIGSPPLGFRFSVLFLLGGVFPNPFDIQFQKVSGLGATVETISVDSGGQNIYTQLLPRRVQHNNLVLERGMAMGSPLVIEFNAAMSLFKFKPSNVLVSLLDGSRIPIAAWLCMRAYPLSWRVTDLDATSNTVVIETMELAYQRLQVIRI